MNTLYIDTRDNKQIIVRLDNNGKIFEQKSEASRELAQATLPMIEKVLSDASLQVSEINEIQTEKGPGSFTGLRVGIAIANALSFGLEIKINGKALGEIVQPVY